MSFGGRTADSSVLTVLYNIGKKHRNAPWNYSSQLLDTAPLSFHYTHAHTYTQKPQFLFIGSLECVQSFKPSRYKQAQEKTNSQPRTKWSEITLSLNFLTAVYSGFLWTVKSVAKRASFVLILPIYLNAKRFQTPSKGPLRPSVF